MKTPIKSGLICLLITLTIIIMIGFMGEIVSRMDGIILYFVIGSFYHITSNQGQSK